MSSQLLDSPAGALWLDRDDRFVVVAEWNLLKAMEIAKLIAANDGRMVQGIKDLMIEDVGATWRRMYDNELGAQSGKLRGTPVKEGFKDFLQRKGVKGST